MRSLETPVTLRGDCCPAADNHRSSSRIEGCLPLTALRFRNHIRKAEGFPGRTKAAPAQTLGTAGSIMPYVSLYNRGRMS